MSTREAMLEGVRGAERVIAGAYTDEHGGVCPMLAAHRRGARTDFLSFARSWDRFARTRGSTRRVTSRELRILVTQLEASLQESAGTELDRAIAQHRELLAQGRSRRARLVAEADPRGKILASRLRLSKGDVAHRAGRPQDRAVPAPA